MPASPRLFLLFTLLALPAAAARAQSRPEPTAPPPQQVVTLRVTLPTAVGYAMRLLSKADKTTQPAGRRAPRTSNPVLVFTVPVPQLLSGKQTAPEPAPTSKKD